MKDHNCIADMGEICSICDEEDRKYYESLEQRIERLESKLKSLEAFQKRAMDVVRANTPIGGRRLR